MASLLPAPACFSYHVCGGAVSRLHQQRNRAFANVGDHHVATPGGQDTASHIFHTVDHGPVDAVDLDDEGEPMFAADVGGFGEDS